MELVFFLYSSTWEFSEAHAQRINKISKGWVTLCHGVQMNCHEYVNWISSWSSSIIRDSRQDNDGDASTDRREREREREREEEKRERCCLRWSYSISSASIRMEWPSWIFCLATKKWLPVAAADVPGVY